MSKHIIYLIIIAVCCCFTNNIKAQSAPGLLGKRLTMSYDFNTHINYLPPTLGQTPEVEPSIISVIFISKHLFGVDYALTRSISLGVDYGFHQQRLDDASLLNTYFTHRLKSNEIGLRLKYFPTERTGSIAPIGPYFQLRILRYGYRSEMELVLEEPDNLTEPYIFPYEEGRIYTGSFGFGRQGILFKNIIYNVGCEMALVWLENAFLELGDASRDVSNALFLGNLFKLKLGIAVPIF